MKRIPLTQGQFALVDDDDFEWLSQWKWCAVWHEKAKTFYAYRYPIRSAGETSRVFMHRAITRASTGQQVDHRFHCGIDNRRENLRLCSHAQNKRNSRPYACNTSGFKGVIPATAGKRWVAQISIGGRTVRIGSFTTTKEAALAYDSAAIKHYGDFALTNAALGLL